MIISQEYEEVKAAQLLASKCELKAVTLRQSHASLEGSEAALNAPFSIRISHSSVASVITDDLLRIETRFQVQSYDSSESPCLLFTIECSFDVDYDIIEQGFRPATESITAFKDGNAIFNTWPYMREFVQNTAIRMALSPPPVPLLRMVPKPKPKQPAEMDIPPVEQPLRRRSPRKAPPAEAIDNPAKIG